MERKKVKIELGGGPDPRKGYLSIDLHQRADIKLNLSSPEIFSEFKKLKDSYQVVEIYSRHFLEHLSLAKAKCLLETCFYLLAKEGNIHIIVPDLYWHARQILGEVSSNFPGTTSELDHALKSIYGWSRNDRNIGQALDTHRWGYTYKSLRDLVSNAGFKKINRILEGKDTEPWHLNIIGVKFEK